MKGNKQNDSRALFALQQAVDNAIFPRIIGATSAKEAWNTIQEEFQGSDEVRNVKLHSLRREFELIRRLKYLFGPNFRQFFLNKF